MYDRIRNREIAPIEPITKSIIISPKFSESKRDDTKTCAKLPAIMDTEPISSLSHALAGVLKNIFFPDTFLIIFGIFLIIFGIIKPEQTSIIIGVRSILLGFGFRWFHYSTWKDFEMYGGIALLVSAFVPTHYYMTAFDYLK
jgi:hypothetical protein